MKEDLSVPMQTSPFLNLENHQNLLKCKLMYRLLQKEGEKISKTERKEI